MSKFNRTKIVATIGPATQDEKTLKKIIQAGVDVCRFNFSHADYDVLKEVYKSIKKINIDPSLLEDKEMLEDLIMVAFKDALSKVESTSSQKMGGLMPPGMNLPF